MIIAKVCVLAVACLAVAACGTVQPKNVTLVVRSTPDGAAIVQNGVVIGRTPYRLYYNKTVSARGQTCITTSPLTARWASGATDTEAVNLCQSAGQESTYTFNRPADAPGLAADLQAANQLAAVQAQQQVVAAPAPSTGDELMNALMLQHALQLMDPPTPVYTPRPQPWPQPPHRVTCTTIGFMTTCN